MRRWIFRILILLVLVGAAAGGAAWYSERGEKQQGGFRTEPVRRGDLLATISATGTVEPEEVVNIGAQVAGQIIAFGTDTNGKPIDYGSVVKKDSLLAQIDDAIYRSELASANAQYAQAKAGVIRAEADVKQLKAKLVQAEADWKRAEKLGPGEALAQSVFDQYKAGYEGAVAAVAVGEAQIEQAKGAVIQADAAVTRATRNLSYTVINSPVDGVIIDRRVNIGQTVVSSLNAPSLFLIAKDLKRMQVWVAVNEADIGQVRPGQAVTFTVDAFPGETFNGVVNKVRLNAQMSQNVVTFTVEVTTDNSNGKLLPYLTANAKFETARREHALIVPNSALRWTPRTELIAQSGENAPSDSPQAGRGRGPSTRRAEGPEATVGTLWLPQGNQVKSIRVRLGYSDGAVTEILGGSDLAEGTPVVVGEIRDDSAVSSGAPASPFIPQFRGRGGGGGGRRGG